METLNEFDKINQLPEQGRPEVTFDLGPTKEMGNNTRTSYESFSRSLRIQAWLADFLQSPWFLIPMGAIGMTLIGYCGTRY